MVEPLRHRQTKEADNRYVRPTATAPHLDSTQTLPSWDFCGTAALPLNRTLVGAAGRSEKCPNPDITSRVRIVQRITQGAER